MADLTLTLERRGSDWRLRAAGELDVATAPRMAGRLNELVDAGEGDVVLDFRGLTFLDSTGMHTLLNAKRRLIRQGRRLEIVCAPGAVLQALQLARLAETLGVTTDGAPARSRPHRPAPQAARTGRYN